MHGIILLLMNNLSKNLFYFDRFLSHPKFKIFQEKTFDDSILMLFGIPGHSLSYPGPCLEVSGY